MRVLAYARVSTEEQADEGYSIPAQRQRIADFCRSQWESEAQITWFVDDGQSAKNLDRPALANLRAHAKASDRVVVLRLDRLTRSVLDLYTLLQEWERAGVYFRSVTEPYDTSSTEGRFMIGLLALLAEWERMRIGERVREVMSHTVRQERRHLSRPPLGYGMEGRQLVVRSAEAAVVREIFQRYAAGQGTRSIAHALNAQGVRTKQGCEWSDFSVTYVLRNPIYTGVLSWQRIRSRGRRQDPGGEAALLVAADHPPLVDQVTWDLVQRRLAERRRRPTRAGSGTYPLTTLARCALCGAPLRGVTQHRYRGGNPIPGRERRYYRCTGRERGSGCTLPYLPAHAVEGQVLEALSPLAPPEAMEQIVAALLKQPVSDLTARCHDLERRLQRWDRAYEAGDLTHPEWAERTAELRQRLQECSQHRPATADPVSEIAGLINHLPSLWPDLPAPAQRTVMTGLITQVTVGADRRVEITYRSYPGPQKPSKGHPLMA